MNGIFAMSNRNEQQAYVYTRADGTVIGTFKLRAIFFSVMGDTCKLRCTWHVEEFFDNGVVVRPLAQGGANVEKTGYCFCLDTRGAMASVMAELEANDANPIARAALMEFARAVEDCWDVRSFLFNLCEEV